MDRKLLATSLIGIIMYQQGLFRNCTECFHWEQNKEICKKYNQKPPAKIIVKGCNEFEDNETPF